MRHESEYADEIALNSGPEPGSPWKKAGWRDAPTSGGRAVWLLFSADDGTRRRCLSCGLHFEGEGHRLVYMDVVERTNVPIDKAWLCSTRCAEVETERAPETLVRMAESRYASAAASGGPDS
jgi:hypothetical protein